MPAISEDRSLWRRVSAGGDYFDLACNTAGIEESMELRFAEGKGISSGRRGDDGLAQGDEADAAAAGESAGVCAGRDCFDWVGDRGKRDDIFDGKPVRAESSAGGPSQYARSFAHDYARRVLQSLFVAAICRFAGAE